MRRTRIDTTSLSTTLRGACLAGGGLTLPRKLALGLLAVSFAIALPAGAQANNLFTLDSQAEVNGPIVTEASGTGYVAWDRQAASSSSEPEVLFCKIPRGGTCTSPITLPLPGGSYQGIVQPFPVLGTHPGEVYVVGPRYLQNDTLIWTSTDGGEKFSAAKVGPNPGGYPGKTSVGDVLLDPDNPSSIPAGEDYFGIAANNPGLGYGFTANQIVSGSSSFTFANPGNGGVASSTLGYVTNTIEDSFTHNQIHPQVEAYYNLSNPAEVFFYRYYAKEGNVNGEEKGWEGPYKVTDGYEPRLAGGPAGLFLLSTDLAPGAPVEEQPSVIDVRKYNEATREFGAPTTIANIPTSAGTLFTSGDIYENPSTGALDVVQPVLAGEQYVMRLWESTDGGQTFHGERNIATIDGAYSEIPRLAVAADGQGWLTFKDAGGLEVADLNALSGSTPTPTPTPTPSPTTLTTTQTSGTTTGASISIPAGTVGESDTATITGTNAASATGTVVFTLYANSSCSGTPAFAGAAEADGTATIADDSSVGLAPGKYYWKATYGGNATNLPSASTCGSEVLTVTPAATIESKGESTSTTVTLTITCASTPCTVTITITVPSSSGKASSARKSKKHPKTTIVTLGTGTFTLKSKGPHRLTVHLSKAGKKLLAADHGRLTAKILVAEKTPGGTVLSTRTIKIVPAKPKHKK
jgi:hypothetical protein